MRVGIYDPYLNTLGGGERYILAIASYLSKKNKVEIFWDDSNILNVASGKFRIDLSGVSTVRNIFTQKTNFFKRFSVTRGYDVIIYLSDGSIPFLFAKNNILLFQFPVNWVNRLSLIAKIKLKKINHVICYTKFVKKYLDRTFNVSSVVIYPPISFSETSATSARENIILSVGRYTKAMNMKKQEVMIEIFKDLFDLGLRKWRLVMIGSFLPDDKSFVNLLIEKSKGYPIEIITNSTYVELVKYYQKAKIYWHAAGFGEDLDLHPERAEHFGITTVEAMAHGVVPVVINAGGQVEIVESGKSGYLWNTADELKERTLQLTENSNLLDKMSRNATTRSRLFNEEMFHKSIDQIIG